MSMTPQGGGLQSQLDLALNPAWGNTTENVTKVVAPKGTTIYEGIAAPQNIYDSLGNVIGTLPGGGNQVKEEELFWEEIFKAKFLCPINMEIGKTTQKVDTIKQSLRAFYLWVGP